METFILPGENKISTFRIGPLPMDPTILLHFIPPTEARSLGILMGDSRAPSKYFHTFPLLDFRGS